MKNFKIAFRVRRKSDGLYWAGKGEYSELGKFYAAQKGASQALKLTWHGIHDENTQAACNRELNKHEIVPVKIVEQEPIPINPVQKKF